jgi:hypothetical protein
MAPALRGNELGPLLNKKSLLYHKSLECVVWSGADWTNFWGESWIFLKYLGQDFMVKFTEGLEYKV